jgi:hypothetical protein
MTFLRPLARLILGLTLVVSAALAAETKIIPLSGLGEPGETPVFWDFKLDSGRRSGEWTTIRVPSCWETEGFGAFYYGGVGRGKPDTDPIIPKEQGTYRTKFTIPADWQGSAVRIVFEAAMTDTTVTINGQPAGPTHQGGFYRFHYDITSLVKIGAENSLEVLVSKESANKSVNHAERRGDYWTFGGIYRPVWLEARPAQHIEWTAIDARADGSFYAQVHLGAPLPAGSNAHVTAQILDDKNQPVGEVFFAPIDLHAQAAAIRGRIAQPKLWTAETPHLYRVQFSLVGPNLASVPAKSIHTVTERFGFRTFEVRPRDGLYLNGTKIVMKGVNRHCFWPETGRTVTREQSYADARLIKGANMNAVRMSHYPPDKHFLQACDELGLYVLDELAGWQGFYDTPTGARLIGQIVRRDVNHPSILFWDNGNEGGWNRENDGEFDRWDPQRRPVLHPWGIHSGINTDHYEKYASTTKLSHGPDIFMPTEFLHGLYDGGIGAGFRDFWDVMGKSPTVGGGFFWVWSDEGVVRADQGGRIDNVGNLAPDGIVGPHRELEGSYYTVKEIWSPVQVELPAKLPKDFAGHVPVKNHYSFTNLKQCSFEWQAVQFPEIGKRFQLTSGKVGGPDVAPGEEGVLVLPLAGPFSNQSAAETLIYITAKDPQGHELWTWTVPVVTNAPPKKPTEPADPSQIKQPLELNPRLVALRRKDRIYENVQMPPSKLETTWSRLSDGAWRLDFEYTVNGDVDIAGLRFDLPDSSLKSKRWLGRGPFRVWQNREEGGVFDLHEVAFNDPIPGQTYAYPEFKGFFRDWRWLTLETTAGRITVENAGDSVPFFGLGKIKSGEKDLITDWPDMGLAFLHVIPAIGTKFDFPVDLGPQSQPRKLEGVQRGTLIFRFE